MSTLIAHPSLVFAVFLIGLLLVQEIGLRLRLGFEDLDAERLSLVQSGRQGLTVLLSFLLGFALPMTLPYYETRRTLVIDEADAISTLDERAQLLPNPYGQRIRQLLPQYVEARLDFGLQDDEAAIRMSDARAERLQSDMWREVVALVQEHPEMVIGPIVAQVGAALGKLADLRDERLAADERRIPLTIWAVMALIAVLTCFVVGYTMHRRQLVAVCVLPLTVAIVLSLVAELENPRTGYIRIGQESLQTLRHQLGAELGH